MLSPAEETLKNAINIPGTNFQIDSIKGLVWALYCDAATWWLEKKQILSKRCLGFKHCFYHLSIDYRLFNLFVL